MFASKESGLERSSSFETLGEGSWSSSDEEIEALFAPSPKYSLTVAFEEAVEKNIKNIGEENEHIVQLWHDVVENKKVKKEGIDEKNRPSFVGLQAVVENTMASFLASGQISAIGTIHTPTPATPLRTIPSSKVEKGLVEEEIEKDPKRLQTVTDRAVIIREYLDEKGELYSAYQTDIDDKCNKITGMDIFDACLVQYSNLHGIQLKTFQPKLTGATYIFGNKEENSLVFSLKAYQANQEPAGTKKWCVWFGPIDFNKAQTESVTINKVDKIERRFTKVNSFLHANGGINMIEDYKQKVNTSLEQVKVTQPVHQYSLNAA